MESKREAIQAEINALKSLLRSLPTRGAWIEIGFGGNSPFAAASLPTRGAWIEISWLAGPPAF